MQQSSQSSPGTGKGYRAGKKGSLFARCFFGASILAIIVLICAWVPAALATDTAGGPAGSGSSTALAGGQQATDSLDTTAVSGNKTAAPAPDTSAGASTATPTLANDPPAPAASTPPETAATAGSSAGASTTAPTLANDPPGPAAAGASGPARAGSATSASKDEYDYELHLICGNPYWGSNDDYLHHLLSIDYTVTNTGTGVAPDVGITKASATNDVYAVTTVPIYLGDIAPGGSVTTTIQWYIPEGVKYFKTDIQVCTGCEKPVCVGDECEPPPCEGDDCKPPPPCTGDACKPPEPICEGAACDPGNTTTTDTMNVAPQTTSQTIHASALPNTGIETPLALLIGIAFISCLAVPTVMVVKRRGR